MVLNSMFLARFMRQWSIMRLGNWLIEVVPAEVGCRNNLLLKCASFLLQ